MKRIGLIKSFLFCTCMILTSGAFGQGKYDKMLNKAEASHTTGDYGKAYKHLSKFKKKVTKKLGNQNVYTPTYFLLLSKYNLASGLVLDFESNVQTAINNSATMQENTVQHGLLLIEAARLYNQNGDYRKARETLVAAQQSLDKGKFMTDLIQARWEAAQGEALAGQGYYQAAIELLTRNARFFAGRALKQESFVDEKGALKSRRLPEEEYKARFAEYGRILTQLGYAYGRQGNFNSADSVYIFAGTWLRKNLDRFSLEYVQNQYHNANLLIENGNEVLPDEMDFDRLLGYLKSSHKSSHYFATQLYEAQLAVLLKEESKAKYNNLKFEYERTINKNFKSTSIYFPRLKAVEFDSKLSRDNTRNLENDAVNLLSTAKGLPKNNIITTRIYSFLYDLSIQQKKYVNTEGYLKSIIDIKADLMGPEAPETHLARIQLANYYVDFTNNINEASKIYKESYQDVVGKEIKAWHKDHLNILNHMAELYELTDRYGEAVSTLALAQDIARSKYDDKAYQYGAELNYIARLQIKLGQYEQAEENINKSLAILEEHRKEEDKKIYLVDALDTQAILFGVKGMFDEAEETLSREAKIISRADVLIGIDEQASARELASLFIQLGRYRETEELLDDAIRADEKLFGQNSLRLIEPLVNKGRLLLLKGDYTEAERIAQRANKIAVSVYGDVSTKAAPTQKLLGDIDYIIGDYDNAEKNIVAALQSQERQFGRNHVEVAKSLAQLGLIKFYKGDDRKEVEKILLEARETMGSRLGKTNPQYADVLKSVAILYISEKRFDIAFNSLTQAEAIWRSKLGTKNNINAASIYALTADVYYQLKNYTRAEDYYNRSKKIYEDYFSRTHPEFVKVLSKQAKVYYMEKDYKRAKKNIEEALNTYENFIKQFFPALSEREKAKYWNTIKGDFEFYNTLAFSQLEDFRDLSGKVYNYQLLTKALLLSSSIKVKERILNSKDEALKSAYNQWVQKKEFLTGALSMSSQQLVDAGIDMNALHTEVETLEKELSEKSELFGQGFENKKITYDNVQKSLGKNDVAIEMIRYRHFDHTFTDSAIYVALYIKPDINRPRVVVLPNGNYLEDRGFRYYKNCVLGRLPDTRSYTSYWEPIQTAIGQYATAFLSPDGVFNQINLEAIPTPDGKYVIDNSNLVLVSNTKDIYLRKLKAKVAGGTSNTATMFGNPTFYLSASASGALPPLPGTEKEVKELEDLLKQKGWKTYEYLEGSATEERVKELESPRIFHIATHGFYTPAVAKTDEQELTENEAMKTDNPMLKSGLILKGGGDVIDNNKYNYNAESGVLTAYEAMSLNLDKTDLVVLSACETAQGDITNGEGVYGLQRAFLVAGAKVLVMSMFKVDDEATQKLILNFYRKWLTTNNLRQSFIDAKRELRVDYPDPYYWGSFVMIGLE